MKWGLEQLLVRRRSNFSVIILVIIVLLSVSIISPTVSSLDSIKSPMETSISSYGEWKSSKVDDMDGSSLDIAVDSDNNAHISYYLGYDGLSYANNSEGNWSKTIVDGTEGWQNSIALDSSGNAYIVYWESDNEDLYYATNMGGSWSTSAIASSGRVGEGPSIALDSNDHVHISFINSGTHSSYYGLNYMTNAEGSWNITAISNSLGDCTSIAVDSNDKIHISRIDGMTHLTYVTNVGGSWERYDLLDDGLGESEESSIALDSENNVYIAYNEDDGESLNCITNKNGDWNITTIDDEWGSSNSIAIDSHDNIYVTYIVNKTLKIANNAGGSWNTTTIETPGNVSCASLAIDTNDKIHIAYHDSTNDACMYLTNAIIIASPSAPQNLQASSSNIQVSLSWTAPPSDGGSSITNYKIYRCTSSGEETLIATIGNQLIYTDTNVTVGGKYYYKVTAVNAKGESQFSNEVNAIVLDSPTNKKISIHISGGSPFSVEPSELVVRSGDSVSTSGSIWFNNSGSTSYSYHLESNDEVYLEKTNLVVNADTRNSCIFAIMPHDSSSTEWSITISCSDGNTTTIMFSLNTDTLSFTNFKLDQDAYSLENYGDWYSGGLCYGMSATSVLLYEKQDPADLFNMPLKETYDLTWDDAFYTVWAYHMSQIGASPGYLLGTNEVNNYDDLITNLDHGHPMVMVLKEQTEGWIHAVVAYGVIEYDDKAFIAIYDPNYPLTSNPYDVIESYAWATYDKVSDQFVYDNYIEFGAISPEPLTISQQLAAIPAGGLSAIGNGILNNVNNFYESTLMAIFACPVDVFVTDELGKKLGIINGTQVSEISGGMMVILGEIKILLLPNDQQYEFSINAYETSAYNITFATAGTSDEFVKIIEIAQADIIYGDEDTIQIAGDLSYLVVVNSMDRTYTLQIANISGEDPTVFTQQVSVVEGELDKFTVQNWTDLQNQETGPVTMQIDNTGDGIYETTRILVSDVIDPEQPPDPFPTSFVIIGVVAIVAIVAIALLVMWRWKK